MRIVVERAWTAYRKFVKRSAGEPGVRCGLCEAVPEPGERICRDCRIQVLSW
jgi:hypothetical protein